MEITILIEVVSNASSSNPENFRNFSLSAALPSITPPLAHATVIEAERPNRLSWAEWEEEAAE